MAGFGKLDHLGPFGKLGKIVTLYLEKLKSLGQQTLL